MNKNYLLVYNSYIAEMFNTFKKVNEWTWVLH